MPASRPRRLASACLVALAIFMAGCVGGKLSPIVPEVVGAVDTAACAVVDVFAGPVPAGAVCEAAAGAVQGWLDAFVAPPTPAVSAVASGSAVPPTAPVATSGASPPLAPAVAVVSAAPVGSTPAPATVASAPIQVPRARAVVAQSAIATAIRPVAVRRTPVAWRGHVIGHLHPDIAARLADPALAADFQARLDAALLKP